MVGSEDSFQQRQTPSGQVRPERVTIGTPSGEAGSASVAMLAKDAATLATDAAALATDAATLATQALQAAALGLLFVLAFAALQPAPAQAQSGGPKLLLLPFVVHTSEPPEYVRGGLSDMLSARFARIGAVQLETSEDAAMATSSLKKALAAGEAAGADYVLFGSFTRFGKGASLDVQCAPTRGGGDREPLREIFVHSGSIGEIIPDLDELAGKVSRFARGEAVASTAAPATLGAGAAGAAPAGLVADLARRVAALEDELAALRGPAEAREYGAE